MDITSVLVLAALVLTIGGLTIASVGALAGAGSMFVCFFSVVITLLRGGEVPTGISGALIRAARVFLPVAAIAAVVGLFTFIAGFVLLWISLLPLVLTTGA